MTGPNARSTTTPWRRSSNNKAYTEVTHGRHSPDRYRPVSDVPRASAVLGAYRRELHLDLRLFFAEVPVPLAQISFREVDQFVERQHHHGRAWATINRRLNALKHFFAFCLEQQWVRGNPVKPSHFVRRGHPLPKALPREQVQRLFAQIAHPMDRALFLVILRCGLRVSEVANLKLEQIDWEQQAVQVVQGKGRKDRRVHVA